MPDKEERKLALWDETAHWRGQPERVGPFGSGDAGQCPRQACAAPLLHGQEQRVYGDSAYASQRALIVSKAPRAKDFTNQNTRKNGKIDEVQRGKNRNTIADQCPGRACLCRGQTLVGLHEGTLPWLEEGMPAECSRPWRWPISTSAGGI